MERKKRGTGINAGSSSIMVIFVLLCLTTFASLSLVSANADYKLSQKTAEAVSAYYVADAQAEEALSVISSWCANALARAGSSDEYLTELQAQQIEASSSSTATQTGDSLTISYTIPVSERRKLLVTLSSDYDSASQGVLYRLLTWKTIPAQEWQPSDDGLKLWDGVSPIGEVEEQ